MKVPVIAAFISSALLVSACVTPEQAARRDANIASEAASKILLLDACFSPADAEVENAKRILESQGGGDYLYWVWWPKRTGSMMARVNALNAVDMPGSCLQRANAGCDSLDLEFVSGYVSRDQAAAGRGEITIKCSPRLEQS